MKKISKKVTALQYLVDLTFDYGNNQMHYEYTEPKNASTRIQMGISSNFTGVRSYYFRDTGFSTWQSSFTLFNEEIKNAGRSGIQLTHNSVIIDNIPLSLDMGADDKFNFTLMSDRTDIEWYEVLKHIKLPDNFGFLFLNPAYSIHDMLNSYDKVQKQYVKKDAP